MRASTNTRSIQSARAPCCLARSSKAKTLRRGAARTSDPAVASPESGARQRSAQNNDKPEGITKQLADSTGISLGPISLTYGNDFANTSYTNYDNIDTASEAPSLHSLSTEEWRRIYEQHGTVDLWLEEEFNAGSRVVGGRVVHKGGVFGQLTGEGPSSGEVPAHKVRIYNRYADQIVDVEVPEDRYVLWEAEDQGLELPYACRMGCCTACAVKVLEGEMYQPEALGISTELREQGYALMCVGFPKSDLVLEVVEEDEVYMLQFGEQFANQALDKDSESVERDDFAIEIAMGDE